MKLILRNDYHDALITAAQIGPRREISLTVILMNSENMLKKQKTRIRISSIENFSEIKQHLTTLTTASDDHAILIEKLEIFGVGIILKTDNHIEITLTKCKVQEE